MSLDAQAKPDDSLAMLAQPYRTYIERTDPNKNMARFYALAIEPTLFGTPCVTRRWGGSALTGGRRCITLRVRRKPCRCSSPCCADGGHADIRPVSVVEGNGRE